jgi:hypothetical protein
VSSVGVAPQRRAPGVSTCARCEERFEFGSLRPPALCEPCRAAHRRCSQCRAIKPSSDFYAGDKNVRCRECVRGDRLLVRECRSCGASYRGHSPLKGSPPICPTCKTSVKWCPSCDEIKDVGAFARARDKRSGRVASCRACRAVAYAKVAGEDREIAQSCRKLGITVERWWELHAEQGGRCRICSVAFTTELRPRLDHCHDTGRIRGLLCNSCNLAIGLLRDNVGIILSAAIYLGGGE